GSCSSGGNPPLRPGPLRGARSRPACRRAPRPRCRTRASRSVRPLRCRPRADWRRPGTEPAARATQPSAPRSRPRPPRRPRSRFAEGAAGVPGAWAAATPRSGRARACSSPSAARSRRYQAHRRVDYALSMRVLIADDHPLILAGIKRALEEDDQFEVVAEARVGSQVLPLISQTNPDLALLDLRMPEMDGLQCLDRIRQQHPKVKVVILSVSTDPEIVQTVLNHGASAYIVKSVNPIDLSSALRQALEGTVFSAIGLPAKRAQ